MNTYTIKGLYVGKVGEEFNPTYFGRLMDCIRYVDNNHFTHYGEDVKICIGDYVVAIQKWTKKFDEVGEYFEAEPWQVRKNGKFIEIGR